MAKISFFNNERIMQNKTHKIRMRLFICFLLVEINVKNFGDFVMRLFICFFRFCVTFRLCYKFGFTKNFFKPSSLAFCILCFKHYQHWTWLAYLLKIVLAILVKAAMPCHANCVNISKNVACYLAGSVCKVNKHCIGC